MILSRAFPAYPSAAASIMRKKCRTSRLWPRVVIAGCLLTTWIAPIVVMAHDGSATDTVVGEDLRSADAAGDIFERRLHYVGEVWMSLSNRGSLGSSHGTSACPHDQGILRLNWCPSFGYPGGSRIDYLFAGGFWFGGIVDDDTLVSVEYSQSGGSGELSSFAPMLEYLPPDYSNTCDGSDALRLDQIYHALYSDTSVNPRAAALHTPMGIEVRQVSHQASDNFARDFVIVELQIKNISSDPIRDFYVGVFVDADVYYQFEGGDPYNDDISGFMATYPNPLDPSVVDTLNTAWTIDNDGDPIGGSFPLLSARGAMGCRFLRYPEGASVSFNWWSSSIRDWGPRQINDTRIFSSGGEGKPVTDEDKYHIMSNNERDYDQFLSARDHTSDGWKPPPPLSSACDIADGSDTRSLLAAGPKETLLPGETVTYTVAFIGGQNIHRYPDNAFDCLDPDPFIAALDYSDLARNAWRADYVYDNHGVDTDGDGYAGEYYRPVSGLDTIYYSGDGCPDFRGPAHPKCPSDFAIFDSNQGLEIRWTGSNTELEVDPLLRVPDFEGYRIYLAESDSPQDTPRPEDYALLASWDVVNWRRYTYEPLNAAWQVSSNPLTVEQWQDVFTDNPCVDPQDPPFDPRDYPNPSLLDSYCYIEIDRFGQMVERRAYFVPQDLNHGNAIPIGDDTSPNLIQRIAIRDTIVHGKVLQYGVYRVVLTSLISSKYYFVSVTTFDFGDPLINLEPKESSPGDCVVSGAVNAPWAGCLPDIAVATFADLPLCDPNLVWTLFDCGKLEVTCERAGVSGVGCTDTPIPVRYNFTAIDTCGNTAECTWTVTVEHPDCPIPAYLTGADEPGNCTCDCHGDPECDGVTNVLDVVSAVGVAFRGTLATIDPVCPYELTDSNCDGVTNVIDVVRLVNVAFRGGDPALQFCDPCAP